MPEGFNPLLDIATFLGNIAKALPKLPPPPSFPPPKSPEIKPPKVEPSGGYVDVTDGLLESSIERYRAEQKAKGLVVFHYE